MDKKNIIIIIIFLIFIIFVASIIFINSNSNNISIQDAISKFKEAGINVNLEEKPYFSMIGAKDGEMFYLDNSPVKLYEFKDKKSYKQALKNFSTLENMPQKGLVVIDTNSSKALEIFNSL